MPIIIDNYNKSIGEINLENLLYSDELGFWDEVAESCEIIAKITRNCTSDPKVKVFDLGKYYFGLSRAWRRQIPNYDDDTRYNIFEENEKLQLEVLAIRK